MTTRYNIDTCAMLVEFNASVWTARKLDKSTTDEVVTRKNAAAKDAARVNKHLLAGRTELDTVQQMIGRARSYVYDNTLPWSDSGLRLLPTVNFMAFNEKMSQFEEEFERLVSDFVTIYPTLITAQALALGDMFKRDDYPTANEIMTKFAFRVGYLPVPTAGDFRVDIGNDAQAELQKKLANLADERVEHAMKDIKQRLLDHLKRMSDRLTVDYVNGEAKPRVFHDTLIDGAHDLCDMVDSLNIVGDAQLTEARKAPLGVDPLYVPDDVRSLVEIISYKPFTRFKGVEGSQVRFNMRARSDAPWSTYEMVALIDQSHYRMYTFIIGCSGGCFEKNKSAMDEVINSWRFQK